MGEEEELTKKIDAAIDKIVKEKINAESHIFRHIVEKNHDDWKYSIEAVTGPADNRFHLKVRGDDITEVLEDLKTMKQEVK